MSFKKYALITGSNSGLGFGIATRLLENATPEIEDAPETLTIVLTCRSKQKAEDAISRLRALFPKRKLQLEYVLLDLSDMHNVEMAVRAISTRYKKLDYVYLNAGAWDLAGIDWVKAIFSTLLNPIQALTHPTFYRETSGRTTKDGMGFIFQSNVFGHYYLKKRLEELGVLQKATKLVLTSSLVAEPDSLNLKDIECVSGDKPYQSSKRILDILHFNEVEKGCCKYMQFLSHPGLCTTGMYETFIGPIMVFFAKLGFWFCRLLGSPWHTISPYIAAFSFIWLALYGTKEDESVKWGSGTTRLGKECLRRTPVDEILPSEKEKVSEYVNGLYKQWHEKLSQ
ncbi:3-keto sterol reductase [Schizosaccharomyces japonicus yFS275]|uniref:3beta-hydroxysteroid 3-dehydrogenase n=1 Tax=Schizosaccharomyces japonicus (strain yFS275 / FY16936) TaxID=402676 RepID=B6K3P5_SCHJY|nr:3-keto sterol reductase [Schizosaccharomyces japonicus yFS275]EEB08102.1 3-keto sterol reductase [Schizosaccharomyces japonicus yFS275]